MIVKLDWSRFDSFGQAIAAGYGKGRFFVYAIADRKSGRVRYVGKASKGICSRYKGGTHTALDAVLKASRNSVFVGEFKGAPLDKVEKQLIWDWRKTLLNVQGKKKDPTTGLKFKHKGKRPDKKNIG